MTNRLSFAQILQKKQPMDQSQNSYFSSSQVKQQRSQPGINYMQETPTLCEMMEEFCQYQEAPESNFVLSFAEKDLNMSNCSQNFVAGENPLDSWIMTQSNLKTNKASQLSSIKKYNTSRNEGCSIIEMSKKYANAKENKHNNQGNLDHLFKFSSRTYEKSMENSEEIGDSHKYGSTSPSINNKSIKNVQMIGDTKIIQSQAYGYAQCENKKENFSKIERSEKMNPKIINVPIIPIRNIGEEDGKKTFRYQNYEETDRKETLDEEEEKQSINHRLTNNANHGNPHAKIMKKLSEEEENLMAGIEDYNLNSEQKRIEDAREQINEYLKIKDKSPEVPQTANIKKFQFLKKTKNSEEEIEEQKIQSTHVHYSFAQNEENIIGNKDSFPCTKQQLQQINEDNQAQENERMLSCIEYTQSEADGEEPGNEIPHENDENYFNYRKLEVSQSIPEKKEKLNYPEPSTLEKYLPMNNFNTENDQIERHEFSPTNTKFTKFTQNVEEYKIPSNLPQRLSQIHKNPSESIEEFSEIVEKVDVQPSIIENNSQRDEDSMNIMNSDHPRFRELSSGEIFQSIDESKEVRPVYHDVSSIDIHISEEISNPNIQVQSSEPENHPLKPNNECIKVPKLNLKISDISSVSNYSNIESALSPIKCESIPESPKEYSNYKEISQVESHQPVSSHESINLQSHADGFIYAMRINSRNSSFTSDYNANKHGQSGSFRSSHSSLHLKEEPSNLIEGNLSNVEDYNMNKNNRKYLELELSKDDLSEPISESVEDPEKEEGCSIKQEIPIEIKNDNTPETDIQESESNNEEFKYSSVEEPNYQPATELSNTETETKFSPNLESAEESIAVEVIKNRNDEPEETVDIILEEIKEEINEPILFEQLVCANLVEELIENNKPENQNMETNIIQEQVNIIIEKPNNDEVVHTMIELETEITTETEIRCEVPLLQKVSEEIEFEGIKTIIEPEIPIDIEMPKNETEEKERYDAKTIDHFEGLEISSEPKLSLPDISENSLEVINTSHSNHIIYDQTKETEVEVIKIEEPAHSCEQQPKVENEPSKEQQIEIHSHEVEIITTNECLASPKIESMRSISIANSLKSAQKNEENFEFDLDF